MALNKEEFVYGWYCYVDGTLKEFRYPAEKESDLLKDGKNVTVEITSRGNWVNRRGVVFESNYNYMVVPA